MGLETECRITMDGRSARGRAHLESQEIRLGAPRKLTIPFKDIRSAEVSAGALRVVHRGGEVSLDLGREAQAWALKIRYPRGRTEKLGAKPGSRIALLGLKDPAFVAELEGAGGKVAARLGKGPYDMIIVRLDAASDLERLAAARDRIVPNGMIWAVWPKGRKAFREDDIRAFGPSTGLVDVKVMSFSDELSGLKLVIPLAQR